MPPQHSADVPVRLVICFVGAALLGSLGESAWLLAHGHSASEMTPITLSCVTGLLALLGRSESRATQRGTNAAPVVVTNSDSDPVPTQETPKP